MKIFALRGLIFAGFGPIILGIVFFILHYTVPNFSLTGAQVFLAILSTYLLAFVQAGVSVFNQIEEWPIAKSLLVHFLCLYVAYVSCYLLNSWIPFDPMVILIFTVIFVVAYLIIWVTVYLIVRATAKNLSKKVKTQ